MKEDFEAKNKQLLEEMPKFYSSRIDYFKPSFESLIRAQVRSRVQSLHGTAASLVSVRHGVLDAMLVSGWFCQHSGLWTQCDMQMNTWEDGRKVCGAAHADLGVLKKKLSFWPFFDWLVRCVS